MNRDQVLSMVAVGLISISLVQSKPAEARKNWTITQRQYQLKKEVDSGLKANELTLKEANSLKDRLSEITAEEQKMKSKNGGKLSYKDEGKLEKKLNGVSVDMQKEKLDKRTTAK